jgi:leucyl-tRNA synthetase
MSTLPKLIEETMKSFCLEGKITEQHAKEIEVLLHTAIKEAEERERDKVRAILETPAYKYLTSQWGQLDEDGTCISVSRQALEETMKALEALTPSTPEKALTSLEDKDTNK